MPNNNKMEEFIKKNGGKPFSINKPIDDNNFFKFGKHKGISYDVIFEDDKQYVGWILEKGDPKYYKKFQEYYKKKIEEMN